VLDHARDVAGVYWRHRETAYPGVVHNCPRASLVSLLIPPALSVYYYAKRFASSLAILAVYRVRVRETWLAVAH
jgi:hypothetical protein